MHRLTATPLIISLVLVWSWSSVVASDIKSWTERAETGDSPRVLAELAQHLQQNPDDYPVMFLQGRLLAKTGDIPAAIKTYRALIQQLPASPEAYNNLAGLYAQQGDYAQAQQLLEQAMRTHPGYEAVYENLGHIYVEMARSSYGKALQLDAGKQIIALQEVKTMTAAPRPSGPRDNRPTNGATMAAMLTPTAEQSAAIVSQPVAATMSTTSSDKDEIITTLQGWAAAWSEQATEVYLIFYADDYVPEGMSRQNWEQERRERLNKPQWIQIGLSQFEVKKLANGEAKVELIQEYRASNYQDRTRKLMQMRQTPDGWRIVAEQSIAKLN